jgi:CHAD domain-containing protein
MILSCVTIYIFMSIAPERSRIVFQKTERALLKLASANDPESVHTFRTTSRRLQTLLEQILPNRDRNLKKLLKMLERIRKRAGKVRDIDVQLAALRSLKILQEPRRKTQLVHSLLELRVKHEKKLGKMLTKDKIREICKRLRRGSRNLELASGRDALMIARKMLSEVVRPTGPVTEDLLHQYRIVVKRTRYAAEFAPKSPQAVQFITQLKRLQDALGNWHDWLTLTQTASKRIGEVSQSSLVAALHNVTSGKFRHAVAALSASLAIRPAASAPATAETAPEPVPMNALPSMKHGGRPATPVRRDQTAA